MIYTDDFKQLLKRDKGSSVVSMETVLNLFTLQSPMIKRVMFSFISEMPLSEWTEGGAVTILERWTSLAASYQAQLFVDKIRAKGLPIYETIEQAAILEHDAGYPRWQAEAMALGEDCILEGSR